MPIDQKLKELVKSHSHIETRHGNLPQEIKKIRRN